jgi:hypothetical protein
MNPPTIWFASSRWLWIAAAMALAALVIALIRRPRIPRTSALLGILGMLCLLLAAAAPILRLPRRGTLAVMIDLSPSTRTANFRDAQQASHRLHELIGDTPYQMFGFAADVHPLDPAGPWTEMPAEQTVFSPAPADAIVLFSDGQFELPPSSPAAYIVADPALENVTDAAVRRLQIRGDALDATISNSGARRAASFTGTTGATTAPVGGGTMVLSKPLADQAESASVELDRGDAWPENDALTIRRSPPLASELWWIGAGSPSSQWRRFSPGQVPHDPTDFLAPAVIVLSNVAAADLGASSLDHLVQYVRDLGGSLLILGGDRAFAAGGYPGTPLEMLSPLSSSPPAAATRWILLVDSSGSMNGPNWQAATQAVVRLLPDLPPHDPVDVGQFAAAVRWWSSGRTAAETAQLPLPPPDAVASGPTNLEPALLSIAAAAPAGIPIQLLLLSDCDAQIDHPRNLIDLLTKKQIHLHVLALGRGSGLDLIRQIARASGGSVVEQLDPGRWVDSIHQLMQTAMPTRWQTNPVTVQFLSEASKLGSHTATAWNRTWLKQDAQPLAKSASDAMAASWRVGSGTVTAIAFSPTSDIADALARLIAQPSRDPRFTTHCDPGAQLHITVDAADKGGYLNDLDISAEISEGADVQTHPLPQSAPGEYEISLPAPRRPAIVTLRNQQHIIDRIAVAGRYAPEFDALGNNHATMRRLADQTGGAVIWPDDHHPIDFHWPRRDAPLTSWLSAAGALLVIFALLRSGR